MPNKMVLAYHVPLTDRVAIEAAVEDIFVRLPSAGRLSSASKVLLKPNLLAKYAPDRAITTHPEVVRAVAKALQKRGVSNIILADSPGGPYTAASLQSIYTGCGMAAVCEEFGIQLYTACQSVPVPVAPRPARLVPQFTFFAPARECTFIINLPKLKTHAFAGLSAAVKNLFGLVPGLQKPEFHARFEDHSAFGRMLVDLCETAKADMHIVDGILAMEGDGPAGGTTRTCNLLTASDDPYLLDLALCRYVGMDPQYPPYLAAAHAEGLCPAVFDEALLVGTDDAKRPLLGFQMPRSYTGRQPTVFLSRIPAPLRAATMRFMMPRPVVQKTKCIGCGKCAESCPKHVISLEQRKAHIAPTDCIRCFCCQEMCPVKAIAIRKNALVQF